MLSAISTPHRRSGATSCQKADLEEAKLADIGKPSRNANQDKKAKEAKRKIQEAETAQSKKRCDRDERIAEIQLKAYWECYPLTTYRKQPEDTPLEDTSEDELIETESEHTRGKLKTGNHDDSDQELIPEVFETPKLTAPLDHMVKRQPSLNASAAISNKRQKLAKTSQASIVAKAEADAKRRKLDPLNLGAGTDPKAINGEVEHGKGKDLMHTRIHHWEPRASVKRGCYFHVTSQGIKATKRENRQSSTSVERGARMMTMPCLPHQGHPNREVKMIKKQLL